MYWLTTNLFSLGQFALLKTPGIKDYFGIPTMIKHKENPNAKRPGFAESVKLQYQGYIEKNQESNRLRRLEDERASRVAAGPPVIFTNKTKKKAPAPAPAAVPSTDSSTPSSSA